MALKLLTLLCIFAVLTASFAERKSYAGYKHVDVTPHTVAQVETLQTLVDKYQSAGLVIEDNRILLGRKVEILLPREALTEFFSVAHAAGIRVTIANFNIQKFLHDEFERLDAKQSYDPNDYNRYEDIQSELLRLVSVCPESFTCEVQTIGLSTEGREINVLKISQEQSTKEVVWIDSLIHSREWIAGTSITKTASFLIDSYGSDVRATQLLDEYDFVILPVFNPDGYVYTWDEDRFWRKNRNVNEGSECVGVDLNRNHRFGWGELPGADTNPCGETYRGPSAASEQEIQVVEAALEQLAATRTVAMMMSVHTAAEAWLMPYGIEVEGECQQTADNADMLRVGEAAAAAVAEAGGSQWAVGPTCATLYAATGITPDFAYGHVGIKYSYTPELRGPGFDPPASSIEPAFNEWLAGMIAALQERELIENGS